MKPISFVLLSLLVIAGKNGMAQPHFQSSFEVRGATWLAWVKLPAAYDDSVAKRWPLIVFVPGIGEVYDNTETIAQNYYALRKFGPNKFIYNGTWDGTVSVGGKLFDPIIISVQPRSSYPAPITFEACMNAIKAAYRVDIAAVHITGLSHGGKVVGVYAKMYPGKVASVVSVTAAPANTNYSVPENLSGGYSDFNRLGKTATRFYGFKQDEDAVVNTNYAAIVDYINNADMRTVKTPVLAGWQLTHVSDGSHCCWDAWYKPTEKWNMLGTTETIYQFMMESNRAGSFTIDTTTTIPPVVVVPPVQQPAPTSTGRVIRIGDKVYMINNSGKKYKVIF